MFSKKPPPPPERRARVSQSPQGRPNTVFSYHANRSMRETNQYRDKGREEKEANSRIKPKLRWLKQLPHLALLLGIVLVATFCLQLTSDAKVVTVGPSESQLFLRDKKVYTQAAQDAFKPWANNNKLTVDAKRISQDLRKQFPELQEVSVSLPIVGAQPTVYIQPAIPKIILVSKSGMFVLDVDGRALISGNQVAGLSELKIPVVNDESGIEITPGNIALPKSTVSFITEVVGQMQAKQLSVSSMTLPAGTNELHVKLDKVGYQIKFNLHGNAREQSGAYLAVKQRLEAERKSPREYIDVRVENKAYYK